VFKAGSPNLNWNKKRVITELQQKLAEMELFNELKHKKLSELEQWICSLTNNTLLSNLSGYNNKIIKQ
jgi:hypothetical protein